ncbi:MAG: acyltransferase [Microgenomates group bacterium]
MIGIGVFRLILALTVVVTHTHSLWGFTLGNPVIAVRTFFIISGFYMSLILNEKYKDRRSFWINRILKIYPIYWVTLLLTIFSCMGAFWLRGNWGEMLDLVADWPNLGFVNQIIIAGSQLTIFGRGWIMFGQFVGKSGIMFLLIPQAWTLVLELWFYLLAPFIVTKKWWIIVIFAGLSLLSRWVVAINGGKGDLWEYRFFPSELIYFLVGVFSYKIYKIFNLHTSTYNICGIFFLIVAVGALSTFNFWGGQILVREWWFYILMMTLIPFLFVVSKNSWVDRQLGELSYPVYITHILVNNVLNPLLLLPMAINRNLQAPIVMIGSVILSMFINHFVQRPIEKIRQGGVR